MSDTRADADTREARDAGILVWGTVAGKLSEAVAPLVIARLLGKAEYGAFGALMLVYATTTVVVGAGVPKALLYFFAERSWGERKTLLRRFIALMCGLAVLEAALLFSLGAFGGEALVSTGAWIAKAPTDSVRTFDASSVSPLAWLGVYALFDMAPRLWPNLAIAVGRPRAAATSGFLRSIATLCGTAVPAALGWGLEGIVAGLIVVAGAYLAGFLGFTHALFRNVTATPSSLDVRSIARYALPLGATEAVSILNAQLDQWLVLMLLPIERLAEYRNGAWQIPVLTTIAYSVGAVQLPRLAGLFARGATTEAMEVWRAAARKAARVVVPLAMVFVVGATDTMVLAFGEEYAASGPIFGCYALLTMARTTAFGSFLLAAGRPADVLKAATWTLLSNLAISLPLALWLGFIGPALGTLLAFVPTVWVYCRYMARAANLPIRHTFPLGDYLAVVAAAMPGVVLAYGLTRYLELPPLAALGLDALLIVPTFIAFARAFGLLQARDLDFVREWLSLRVLRNPG